MSAIYKSLTNSEKSVANGDEESRSKNRQRVLLISSRGVTFRHRHLIADLTALLPHARKESKFDSKTKLYQLNEMAELYNCNNIMYFEARKHQDLYLWLSKAPNGPTAKFHIKNLHTMDELNFTGNCLKGSRPVLSFDGAFDKTPETMLLKEVFIHAFGVPPRARKSKPFVDHVMTFSIVDNMVWVRNYQITETVEGKDIDNDTKTLDSEVSLVEIGPRFVMTPILILEGSFGGPVIYENKEYVSPNFVRAQLRAQQANQARARQDASVKLQVKRREQVLSEDPLSARKLFK